MSFDDYRAKHSIPPGENEAAFAAYQLEQSDDERTRQADEVESYMAQFDEVGRSGRRFTLGIEEREREADGATPTHSWYRGEEYEFDTEDDEVAIYVRRL